MDKLIELLLTSYTIGGQPLHLTESIFETILQICDKLFVLQVLKNNITLKRFIKIIKNVF